MRFMLLMIPKGYESAAPGVMPEAAAVEAMMEYNKAMTWMFSHYALFEILALPIVSFLSWLSFKKWGYNYIENIIINCFAGGQRWQ